MNILIAGGGKVGYNIAKLLYKKHNITLIEKDTDKINFINESLDVLCISGDLRDALTYQSLEKEYDYFIAVTNEDEINLISAAIIDDFSKIKNKLLRIQNTSYSLTDIAEKLHIENMIYSNTIPVLNIEKLIKLPQANNVKDLAFTDMLLISVNSEIEADAKTFESESLKIIATVDEDENINFCHNCKINKNDLIYIMGTYENLKKILKFLAPNQPQKIENVLIFGADSLGIELANVLKSLNLNVTIIEADSKLAYKAAKKLDEEIMVINASFDDENLFISENLQKNDVSIATTKSDETNILKSLIAKKYGIKKPICINNNPYYHSIMNSLHLPIVRGPKMATVYKILENIESENIIFERFFVGFKARVFIRKIFISKKIKPPKECCKILILRDEKLLEIKEEFEIKEGDIVFYFNTSGNKSWIENL